MNYREEIENLREELIGHNGPYGFLVTLKNSDFDIEKYKYYRDRFKAINDAAIKEEVPYDVLLEAVSLSHLFYAEILDNLNPDGTELFSDVVADASNTFGYYYDDKSGAE